MFSDYSIRPGEIKDINAISKLHSEKKTGDYFLPFGVNFKWFYILTKCFFCYLIIDLLLNYESNKLTIFNSDLDLLFNMIFFTIFSYRLFKVPYQIFERCKSFEIQKYSQFILLEYENKILCYARFANIKGYSVIYHLYILKDLKEELINSFIENIINQVIKPVYMACSKKDNQYYINIGFKKIQIGKLPENLRFRGWLNKIFAGDNLIYK